MTIKLVQARKGGADEVGSDSVVYVFIDGIRLECRAPTWAGALLIATRIAKTMGIKFDPENVEED